MSNHAKASIETLEQLHNALATALAEKIAKGEATAADLGVARQFLKDNGIESLPGSGNKIGELADKLPFQSADTVAASEAE